MSFGLKLKYDYNSFFPLNSMKYAFYHASGNWTMGAEYFRNEYTLNYIIATYSKPQVICIFSLSSEYLLIPF